MQDERLTVCGATELSFELQPGQRFSMHHAIEYGEARPSAPLGAAQCEIRAAQEVLRLAGPARLECNAKTRRREDLVPMYIDRRSERCLDSFGYPCGVRRVGDVVDEEREFIGTEPGNGVPGA